MTAQHSALEDLHVGRERGRAGPVLPALHMHRLILCTSLDYLPLSLTCSTDKENMPGDNGCPCVSGPRLVASVMASVPHRHYEFLYVKKKWEAVDHEHISRENWAATVFRTVLLAPVHLRFST